MAHAVVILLLAVASVFGLYVVGSMLYCTMAECARCVLLYSIATPSAARGEQAGYAAHNNNNPHHDAAASTRLSVDSKEETRLRVSDAEHTDTCCICLVTPRPTHDTTRHASSSTTTALQVTSGKKLEKTKKQNQFQHGDYLHMLCCEHAFHQGCIAQWVRHKKQQADCPLCRRLIFHTAVGGGV